MGAEPTPLALELKAWPPAGPEHKATYSPDSVEYHCSNRIIQDKTPTPDRRSLAPRHTRSCLPALVPSALFQSLQSAEHTPTLGSPGDRKMSRNLKGTGYWRRGEAGGDWSSGRWPIVLGNTEGRAR